MKNQSFKARHVDVTAKFSTSLNSSINRDEDLENKNRYLDIQAKANTLCKNVENKHQQLREFFQLFYLRIPKCLEKKTESVLFRVVL